MYTKKLSFLLAAALVTVSISGCSAIPISKELVGDGNLLITTESLQELNEKQKSQVIKAFNQKFEKTEITTVNLDFNILADMDVGISGLSLPMNFDLNDRMIMDCENQKAYQDVTGDIEVFGMKMDLEADAYCVNEDDQFVSYSNFSALEQESGWQKETIDNNIFENYEVVPAVLKEEDVKAIYQTEDAAQYLIEMNAEQASSFTQMFEQFDGASDITVDFSDITTYMTVDEGMEIVGYYMDLKDSVESTSEDAEISVNTLTMSMKLNALNEEEKIELPKEVKNAEEASDNSNESLLQMIEQETVSDNVDANTEPVDETRVPQIQEDSTETPQVHEETTAAAPSSTTSADIVLNGQSISLPCTVSDLVALGMTMNEEVQINPGDFKVISGHMGGEDDFYLTAYNNTTEVINSNQATVKTIGYDAYLVENPIDYSAYGIKIGMSVKDAEAILGEPIGLYTGSSGYVSKDYTVNNYEISIEYHDDIVTAIDVSV